MIWTTRDGRELELADMSALHLANAIRMLERAEIRLAEEESAGWRVSCMIQGEYAQDTVDASLDRICERRAEVRAMLDCMQEELNRR